jgi:hypothetical protein
MKPNAALFALVAMLGGCFYPPTQQPTPQQQSPTQQPTPKQQSRANEDHVKLAIPYDLAWDAVHSVIADNGYEIITEDPNHGIIETQAPHGFTLKDADCGKIRNVFGYAAQPELDSTAVYNFEVKPADRESSLVSVQATFTAQVQVPFHPLRDQQCLSRDVQESLLLKQIEARAAKEHRPESKAPSQ